MADAGQTIIDVLEAGEDACARTERAWREATHLRRAPRAREDHRGGARDAGNRR